MRIFVLSGQFGWIFSAAMLGLADQLKPYGTVSTHVWDDTDLLRQVNNCADPKITIIGFSLGANMLGYINNYTSKYEITLGVAYDPSKQSPLVHWDAGANAYVQSAPKFKKLICYYNKSAWFLGGSTYIGANVEIHIVNNFHWFVSAMPSLHEITIAAVKRAKEA